MAKPSLGRLPGFSTIGLAEKINLAHAMRRPLSGYLGGRVEAGYWCSKLAEEWRETFGVKYAIPCNSATSGLLAACMAAKIGPGDIVWTTPTSMSATAACAKVLGADVRFIDIEPMRYSLNMNNFKRPFPKAIIVANIFGHPAYLRAMRAWCDAHDVVMIEDNAQSPFAKEGDDYAGTIGHIGVFSLNVHKAMNAGEGGVCVTNDGEYSLRLRCAINHGELANTTPQWIGLNLRMAEPIAAIACAQLAKAPRIIAGRIALAEEITDMFRGVSWIMPPQADLNCRHVYYMWVARVMPEKRPILVQSLRLGGIPFNEGYCRPLNELFDSSACPVAEKMHHKEFMTFEICSYDPKTHHLKKMREIIKKSVGALS